MARTFKPLISAIMLIAAALIGSSAVYGQTQAPTPAPSQPPMMGQGMGEEGGMMPMMGMMSQMTDMMAACTQMMQAMPGEEQQAPESPQPEEQGG